MEPLFGPHLHFHPEEETTPDENDLFPSTPLDEDQLIHADSKLKEELGSVIINTIQVLFSLVLSTNYLKKFPELIFFFIIEIFIHC